MPENTSPEERIEQIESLITDLIEKGTEAQASQHQNSYREPARVAALLSIVRELCLHAGLSQEQFSRHLQARIDHYDAFYLKKLRDADEHLVQRVDIRTTAEVVTDRNFDPLFPEEEQNSENPPPSSYS